MTTDIEDSYRQIAKIIFKYFDKDKTNVFIFGSRVTNKAKKFSDIDIGIKSEIPVDGLKLSAIEEELEESDIPFLVDVVDFSQVSDNFKMVATGSVINLEKYYD